MGKHLPAIDGLRAVAVLAVIAYHAGAPAGYVGVDVFFVISGYVITRVLLADGSLPAFYARRARRILPAAFLVVLATLALSFLLLPSAGDVARSAAAAGVFVANIHFQSVTGGYWDQSAETMPLLHLWSLSVEEQFYLLWPLVLLFGRKWIGWLALASLALYAVLSYVSPEAAFYQTPARAWELAAGGLVALGKIRHSRIANAGLPVVLLACLVPMPVWAAQPLAVLGTTMLVASIHAGHRSVLESKPLVWVGLISYSLYLWHWPLLAIDRATRIGESPLSTRLALVAAAFALAVLTYRHVEQPFRRAQMRPRRAITLGVTCAAALSCTAFVMADPAKAPEPAVTHCHADATGNGKNVVLWGDSFTDVWIGCATQIAKEQGVPMVRFFSPGCQPSLSDAPGRPSCRKQAEEALAHLRAHGADTLIVAGWWARMLRQNPDAAAGVLAWAQALPHVRRIVVVGAIPELRDSVEKCVALGASCDIPRAEYEKGSAATKRMTAALAKLPNVEVIELGDWMCDADRCRGVRDGVQLYYRDNHHASHAAVAQFMSSGTQPTAE